MKVKETKQSRAIQQFTVLKSQFMKLLLGAPEYGVSGITLHYFNGEVTRMIFHFEESVLPVKDETL